MVSALVPDWSREHGKGWNPSRALLSSIRAYQRTAKRSGPMNGLRRRLAVIRHRWWSMVTGADIPLNTKIAGGLLIPHPNGIVIHPDVVIGPNCLIFQQVTLGSNGRGCPRIGGHVDIGAGAKILGPITIGSNVRIGANSVVLQDIPEGKTVVGIPGRILE